MIVKSISILCSSILPETNPGIFHVITVLLTSLRTAFPALWCDVTTTTSYSCVDANLLTQENFAIFWKCSTAAWLYEKTLKSSVSVEELINMNTTLYFKL